MNDVIPDGWSNPKLDDIVTKFQNGYAFSAKGYVPEGIPIISMGSIQLDGTFKKNNTKLKYWDAAAKEDLSRYLVKSEDLIMAMTDVTPTMELIGRACIVKGNGEYFLNQRVGLISVDEEKSSKPFLSYLTNFNQWRSYCIGSSGLGAQANLGTSQILDGSILLPPLPEQQKIAAILSSVDEVIERTQAQINKLKDLKTGMMQELLSPREGQATNINNPQGESKNGLHHTEFKDSPLGRIPVGWEVVPLGNKASLVPGYAFSSTDFTKNGTPLIRMGNLYQNRLDLKRAPKFMHKDLVEKHPRFVVSPNDIVFSMTGTSGKEDYGFAVQIPNTAPICLLNQRVAKVVPSKEITKSFLLHLLHSRLFLDEVYSAGAGTKQANLSSANILDIKLPFPPIEEQEKIANALNSVSDRISVISKRLNALSFSKKALMQDLLTGKVRVTVPSHPCDHGISASMHVTVDAS